MTADILDLNSANDGIRDLPIQTTLHGVLDHRAKLLGERIAYTFEAGQGDRTITFSQLNRRARAIAAHLQQHVTAGDRVLLLFPAGLDFIAAFFGCLYAGVRAVPTTYPKPRRPMPRLKSIAEGSGAIAALTVDETLATIDESIKASQLPTMNWYSVEGIQDELADEFTPVSVSSNDLAFLQYTSGSTSDPKGVMVSHGNLLHNLEMIRRGFGLRMATESTEGQKGVFWLPAYHDMGLIGGILESLYVGGHSILMSPAAFLQRPMSWLEDMSKFQAAVSGAPNFAYELCVARSTDEQRRELDLSHWEVAFCGAEPIRAETIDRFTAAFSVSGLRDDVFYPCYGLAEGTLLAAGPNGPGRLKTVQVCRTALERNEVKIEEQGGHPLVTCGGPQLGQRIVIADPDSRVELPPHRIGEVWVQGDSVAQGYWNRPVETKETFQAYLATPDGKDLTQSGPFMRTGDLGFIHDGELVVTARVKDVIIIRGRNHYPQDIEQTIADSHEALRPDAGAVFSIDQDGEEKIVAIHEVERQFRNADFDEIIRGIRVAVAKEHELEVPVIVLIRHMSLPRTTSGKPQRHVCRKQYDTDELKVVAKWSRSEHQPSHRGQPISPIKVRNGKPANGDEPMTREEIDRLAERIESWLLNWLIERAAIPAAEVDANKPFAEYGLDSLTAVELSQELEDLVGVEVVPTVAWNYPTPATLSVYLAKQVGGVADEADDQRPPMDADNEFDHLLAEIEALSDEAAKRLLDE